MKQIALTCAIAVTVLVAVALVMPTHFMSSNPIKREHLFAVQSIDTMKYSRDMAREKINDASFSAVIDEHMRAAIDLGATHIAVGTPYDEEFVPKLERWVAAARAANLSIWFRGNFSGWEGWFGYKEMTRDEHTKLTANFIAKHPELFQNGDLFTSCPECENGGPGDPRTTGDTDAYREFLIDEASAVQGAFRKINKQVLTPYYSMNADVARLVMDKQTTARLGGIVVIDHYVSSARRFGDDIAEIAAESGGLVGIGEFGAPIPDINGHLSDEEQAHFINDLLERSYLQADIIPVMNYWTLRGGSTAIVQDNGTRKPAFDILKKYYTAPYIVGMVINTLGEPIADVPVTINGTSYQSKTGKGGDYQVFLPHERTEIVIGGNGYASQTIVVSRPDKNIEQNVTLTPENVSWFYKVRGYLYQLEKYLGIE